MELKKLCAKSFIITTFPVMCAACASDHVTLTNFAGNVSSEIVNSEGEIMGNGCMLAVKGTVNIPAILVADECEAQIGNISNFDR